MSTSVEQELTIGWQASLKNVITEEELFGFYHLVEMDPSERQTEPGQAIPSLLLVCIVGGLLNNRIPSAKCVNVQFEFLAPVFIGDAIETSIELIELDRNKHLATLRTDCYNQKKNQVITGRTIMFV